MEQPGRSRCQGTLPGAVVLSRQANYTLHVLWDISFQLEKLLATFSKNICITSQTAILGIIMLLLKTTKMVNNKVKNC